MFKVECGQFNHKNVSNIKECKIPKKMPKIHQNMSENVFYGLSFAFSRRFGDLYRRPGDSVCIQETPGLSWRVGTDAFMWWILL